MNKIRVILVSLLVLLFAASAWGQGEQQMSKEEQEMMQKWMVFATPGAPHQWLEKFTGEWTTDMTMWMKPSTPPLKGKGVETAKMILGGRYLEENFSGDAPGMPQMEGRNIIGYDNFKKKYVSYWIDNAGTGIYYSEGTVDKDGTLLTFMGTWDDIMTGGKVEVTMTYKYIDADTHFMEMYQKGGIFGDKPFKSMTVEYKRKK